MSTPPPAQPNSYQPLHQISHTYTTIMNITSEPTKSPPAPQKRNFLHAFFLRALDKREEKKRGTLEQQKVQSLIFAAHTLHDEIKQLLILAEYVRELSEQHSRPDAPTPPTLALEQEQEGDTALEQDALPVEEDAPPVSESESKPEPTDTEKEIEALNELAAADIDDKQTNAPNDDTLSRVREVQGKFGRLQERVARFGAEVGEVKAGFVPAARAGKAERDVESLENARGNLGVEMEGLGEVVRGMRQVVDGKQMVV